MTIAARPTVYRGIHMRSRLEARFAAYLDTGARLVWTYEPRAYGGTHGQYLPDFQVDVGTSRYFIEVKPTRERALAAIDEGRMEVIWESEPRASLVVVTDGVPVFWRGPGQGWEELRSEWTRGGALTVMDEVPEPDHLVCDAEQLRLQAIIADRDDEIRDKNLIIQTLREAAGRI